MIASFAEIKVGRCRAHPDREMKEKIKAKPNNNILNILIFSKNKFFK